MRAINDKATERERTPRAVGRRLRTARLARGLAQEDVGEAANVSRAAVSQWEQGQTTPTYSNLEAVAALLDVPVEWLRTGIGNVVLVVPTPKQRGRRAMRYVNVTPVLIGGNKFELSKPPFSDAIPVLDTEIGTGEPYKPTETVIDWIRLSKAYVHGVLGITNTAGLREMRVRSVNMEPTIRRGAYVLIDTLQTTPVDAGVYAIDNGISLVLKRVHVLPGHQLGLTNDADDRSKRGSRMQIFKRRELEIVGRCISINSPL